jgi:tetratricopeptide (TPR) repeat protein
MNFQRLQKEPKKKTEAYRHRQKGDLTKAVGSFQDYLKLYPKDITAALDLGYCLMSLERFEDASKVYAKIIEQDSKHVVALSNLGGALYRAGKPRDAKAILEYALQLDSKCLYAHINMGGVLQSLGDLKGNLNSALAAVSIEPRSALAFNNLGSALSELAMFSEAKHAYETAAMLEPTQVDALINLAAVEARLGSSKQAVDMYEKTLSLLPAREKHRADAVKFYASFEYLRMGELEKGWDYYEGGFSPMVPIAGARSPNRSFKVPKWNGESLEGKRLLIWREQGLGDELLFGSCLHELQELNADQIIIECDHRLAPVFARSFPTYVVRPQSYFAQTRESTYNDFDFHLPIASLMKFFRRRIEDFQRGGPYIVPNEELVNQFQQRLAPFKDKPLVGICWRSGKLSPVRNLSYTVLEEWLPILKCDKVRVVSLQYGDAEAEIKAVEAAHGIEIIRWQDLNQKDELDKVFALMKCLDLAISVNTAPLRMASAVGIPVLGVEGRGWTRLGEKQGNALAWFPNNLLLEPDESCGFESRIVDLVKLLEGFVDPNG